MQRFCKQEKTKVLDKDPMKNRKTTFSRSEETELQIKEGSARHVAV